MSKRSRPATGSVAARDKEAEMSVDSDETLAEELDGPGDDATEILSRPPQTDDLAVALAARPAKAKLPRVTLALGAAVLICAGFIGGALVEKHSGGTTAGRGAAFGGAAFTGGGFSGGGFAGRGGFGAGAGTGTGTGAGTGTGTTGAGGGITGTITVVSGNTLYVTSSSGTVYTIQISGTTAISVAQSGTVGDLKAGQSVTVSGSAGTNGDVTATTITAKPSGGQ
jgi:hypothetical protein